MMMMITMMKLGKGLLADMLCKICYNFEVFTITTTCVEQKIEANYSEMKIRKQRA